MGGTHVDYVTNWITCFDMNKVNKKKKEDNVKAHNMKNISGFLSMLVLTTLVLILKLW